MALKTNGETVNMFSRSHERMRMNRQTESRDERNKKLHVEPSFSEEGKNNDIPG